MKKLKNMKVKERLTKSFIFIAVISSIAGLLGAALMLILDFRYSKALENNGFIQGEMGEYNTYLNKGASFVRDIIMLDDEEEIVATKEKLADADAKMTEYLNAFEAKLESDEERRLAGDIEAQYPTYVAIRDEVIALGDAGKKDEALEKFRAEAIPVLNAVMADVEELIALNVKMGDQVSGSMTLFTISLIILIVVCMLIALGISVKFAFATARDFIRPLEKVQEGCKKLANGELDVHIQVNSRNEFGEMADHLNEAIAKLRQYVEVIDYGLEEVGKGNFAVRPTTEFNGDFVKIKEAIENITIQLSKTLNQINEGADQVALGSEQLAESAQTLAEGATSQAASVQELTATIENVAEAAEDSAQKAEDSAAQADELASVAQGSSDEMKLLTEAMDRITATSQEIESIIAEIEDIAAQTNLLSLNASIEAARAGEAGRGFAVVADQIGKLAADSAQSAVNTRELIVKSLSEIEQGNDITSKTAEALEQVVAGIKEIAEAAKGNSVLSAQQAETMAQVQLGIEQIADVVQNNSASAEETSATSEELSAQSQNLKSLIEQFVLRQDCL